MLVKRITFTDYADGHERTEDFCFHISESELAKLNYEYEGGLQKFWKKITDAEDGKAIADVIEQLINMSYGVRSLDGKYFRKSEEALLDFKSTDAYNKMFMELVTSDDTAIAFIKGILPAEMQKDINEEEIKALAAEKKKKNA